MTVVYNCITIFLINVMKVKQQISVINLKMIIWEGPFRYLEESP